MRPKKERTIETDFFGLPVGKPVINSKIKGNRNELVAAKWLQAWTGKTFTRTPSSGGMSWKDMSSVCGDVVCTDKDFDFRFSVETKHLKSLGISSNVLRLNSKVFSIWLQAARDAERAGKEPMLMLRENGMAAGVFYIFFSSKWRREFGVPNLEGFKASGETLIGYDSERLLCSPFLYSDISLIL